jgi:hypothetical protein
LVRGLLITVWGKSMSSVSHTDSGVTNYYAKDISKIEEEIKEQGRLTRERNDEQLQKLEERQKANLEAKENDMDKAVRYIQSSAADALTNEREKYDAALERVKDQTYNNRGVTTVSANGESASVKYYADALRNQEDANKFQKQKLTDNFESEVDRISHQKRDELLEKDRKTNDTVRNVRQEADNSLTKDRELYQSKLDDVNRKLSDSKREDAIPPVPFAVYKKQLTDLYDGSELRHKRDAENAEEIDLSAKEKIADLVRKQDTAITHLTQHQAAQTQALEEQVKDLNSFTTEEAKKMTAASAEKQNERDINSRAEYRRLKEAFNGDNDRLRKALEEQDSNYAQKGVEALKFKDEHYTKLINQKENENYANLKDVQDKFKRTVDQNDKIRKIEEKRSNERLENTVGQANQERANALEKQALTYQQTIERNKRESDDVVDTLSKTLHKQKTTDDGNELISPRAEAHAREGVVKEYEKVLKTETEKNKVSTDHMQQKYIDQYKNTLDEYEDKITHTNQTSAGERAFERAQYLDSIHETEDHADSKVRSQDQTANHEREALVRQFVNASERQRRDYDNIFINAREDSATKLTAARQEAQFESRNAQRTSNFRVNEIIRDYEKKLTDQKTEADFKYDDLQAQIRVDMRDIERKQKKDLDTQALGYEQRIAQMEAQAKERERYVSQTYQAEIDRTKRSYELLSKKKS